MRGNLTQSPSNLSKSSSPLRHFLLPSTTTTTGSNLPLDTVSTPYSTRTATTESISIPLMPHGGLTRKLLETLSSSSSVPPVSALLAYTFDTTEPSTAFFLADALAVVLSEPLQGLEKGIERLNIVEDGVREGEVSSNRLDWKVPKSWESGLMGAELGLEQRTELFG